MGKSFQFIRGTTTFLTFLLIDLVLVVEVNVVDVVDSTLLDVEDVVKSSTLLEEELEEELEDVANNAC